MDSNEAHAGSCLSDSQLAAWHARELPEAEAAVVRGHLEACGPCRERADRLGADHAAWLERLRAAGGALRAALTPRPNALPEHWDIPGYEVLSEIRRGGQGIVYRALQAGTKREVALKVLREGRYASDVTRRRFEREIELAAALRHPHIVTVFDSGRASDGSQYFAMDYIRGVPLDRYAFDPSLGLRDKLRLFSTVAKAVNYAHQRGVIHRDLKPSNILIDQLGEPHILDFGLAHPLEHQNATITTTAGCVSGTLPYMSPEQARGLPEAIDIRSDVYTLGVILYELLTGRYPYPIEADVLRSLQHIVETPPERPSRLRVQQPAGTTAGRPPALSRIDADVETIMMKALAKEQENRYQSAGDLARDIDLYWAGEPIQARRASSWYVLRKAVRRHRVAFLGAAAVVLVISAALVVSASYWRQAVNQRDAARRAEAQARQNFEQTRALARYFILYFDPLIAHLPGAAPARQEIVDQGRTYLEILATQDPGDVEMQLELAAGYTVIGDIQGDLNAANLGKPGEALNNYRQAEDLLSRIEAGHPGLLKTANLRTLNRIKIADALKNRGELDACLTAYQETLAMAEQAVATHPDVTGLRIQLGHVHERLGYALSERGELETAKKHFDEADRVVEETSKANEDDALLPRRRALAHFRQATILYARGDREQALQEYGRYVEGIAVLLAQQPDSTLFRRDATTGYQWLGILAAELGRHEDALEPYRRSIVLSETLLQDDPEDELARAALATTLSKLGETYIALGEPEKAAQAFERSLTEAVRVADRRPDLASAHRLLGICYYKMAELSAAAADDEGRTLDARRESRRAACGWLQQCLDQFQAMRDRGILAVSDAGVPEELTVELANCRKALARLESPASSSQPDRTRE